MGCTCDYNIFLCGVKFIIKPKNLAKTVKILYRFNSDSYGFRGNIEDVDKENEVSRDVTICDNCTSRLKIKIQEIDNVLFVVITTKFK